MRARAHTHTHTQTLRVAVYSSEAGTAHGATFGDGHPNNMHLISDVLLSGLEAEYKAVCGVLRAVPWDLPVLVMCCTAQGH